MGETSAFRIAQLILRIASEQEAGISNLKLQKLLYYSQAWYLAITNKPLFHERIEAWIHGPVVPPVFGEYKQYRWSPLPPPDNFIEIQEPAPPARSIAKHVREVMTLYGPLTGPQLEALTHQEDPWKIARNNLPPDAPSSAIITHQSMINFYAPMIKRSGANA